MRNNLTQIYHYTCGSIHLPNFREKRPILCKTPSLDGTTKPFTPPPLTLDTGRTHMLLTNSPVASFSESGLVHSLTSITVYQRFPAFLPETAKMHPIMPSSTPLTRSPSVGEKVSKKIAQQWTPPTRAGKYILEVAVCRQISKTASLNSRRNDQASYLPSSTIDTGRTHMLLTNSPVASFSESGLVHSLASITVHQRFPAFHPETAKTHPVMPNSQ